MRFGLLFMGAVVGAPIVALIVALGLRSTGQRITRGEFALTVLLGGAFIGTILIAEALDQGA